MSGRKDLRKSLGLSEYPWSSDDENENLRPEAPQDRSMRDSSRDHVYGLNPTPPQVLEEPQPSTSSSIHHSRRAEARKDRDTFWSLLNSPNVPAVDNSYRIPRKIASFPSSLRSVVHVPPVELREETGSPSSSELRSILVLNKLSSKALSYLRHRTPNPGTHSAVRGDTGSQRNALPQSLPSTRRPSLKFKKLRLTNSNYLSYVRAHDSPPRPTTPGDVLASPSDYTSNHRSSEPIDLNPRDADIIINDDSVDLEPSDSAVPNVPLQDEVSLEDIVEIEPETDLTVAEQPSNSTQDNSTSEQNQEIIIDGASPRRGVKRKREGAEEVDDAEAFKELNRNLLRLLECPVCLEWAEPPIAQCRRGHLVCSCCRARIASCPVCRTSFSSVRNRAMEGVAELLRYPCRHGCGREVRLRRRAPHEASCPARRYLCPAPACDHRTALLPHNRLLPHFQQEHPAMVLMGPKHLLSVHMNCEQTENWFVSAHQEVFHVRVTVDVRSWGLVVHVSYIGPKCRSQRYIYQVSVIGQHHERQTTYSRATHNHLDCHFLSISKQDCFHLTLDQALNFLRHENKSNDLAQNRHLEFYVEIKKSENEASLRDDESDS